MPLGVLLFRAPFLGILLPRFRRRQSLHLWTMFIIIFFFWTMDEVRLFEEFDRLALLDDAHPFKESSRLSLLDDVHLFKESYRHFSFWDDVHPFKESYHLSLLDDVHPFKESYRLSSFRTIVRHLSSFCVLGRSFVFFGKNYGA